MLTKNKLKNIRAYANAKCVIESIADAQKMGLILSVHAAVKKKNFAAAKKSVL